MGEVNIDSNLEDKLYNLVLHYTAKSILALSKVHLIM
jgi:hypothetical protein